MENVWRADYKKWEQYFKQFKPKKHHDPSSGTCAAFCAIERWNPTEIGLIGMDWVLDGNKEWFHDARAELECLQSLVKVIDLREMYEDRSDDLYYDDNCFWNLVEPGTATPEHRFVSGI
jgi:hypothetical protein